MENPDKALQSLKSIAEDFQDFCQSNGQVTEADTRAKLIDRILIDSLGWSESNINREQHTNVGYLDYCLSTRLRSTIVVEAKREGKAFEVPITQKRRSFKLTGALLTDRNVKSAIEQVRAYCDEQGIHYAVATNGYAWIVFRAVRDDMPWRKGHARVFPSIQYIIERTESLRRSGC